MIAVKFIILIQSIYLVLATNALEHTIRLDTDVTPESYSLKIKPDIEKKSYYGEVTIIVKVKAVIPWITLHSSNLIIKAINLDQLKNDEVDYKTYSDLELLQVFYKNRHHIAPGQHIIHIRFEGKLSLDNYVGFFLRKDEDSNNNTIIIATTKFSSTFARRAFPCFDDPAYKTPFRIRLVAPDNLTALSNMPEIASFRLNGYNVVDFQETLPMSTYLVDFTFTNLDNLGTTYTNKFEKRTPLRAFSSSNHKEFPLEVTKKVLNYFEDYTNIPYSFPKLDLLEVPSYPSSGMEHWGLITFIKGGLVPFDNEVQYYSTHLERSIFGALLIAHEVCHQWLGNLVTHNWYNDLWLTEGFAKFLEYKAIDAIYPQLKVGEQFPLLRLISAYDRQNDRPIVFFSKNFSEIAGQFSTATVYSKGAAILAMTELITGEENFKLGLRNYLRKYGFRSASVVDFLEEIQLVVPKINLINFMETWLLQASYPIVRVEEGNGGYILRQQPVNDKAKSGIFGGKWTIPVVYVSNKNKTEAVSFFDRDMDEFHIPKLNGTKWIKLNPGHKSFYRTIYSDDMYQDILNNFEELSPNDQAHFIYETFSLFYHHKYLSCEYSIRAIGKLKNNKEYTPFAYARGPIHSYVYMFRKYSLVAFDFFKQYISDTFEDALNEQFFTNKSNAFVEDTNNYEPDNLFSNATSRLFKIDLLRTLCMLDIQHRRCPDILEILRQSKAYKHNDYEGIYSYLKSSSNTVEDDYEDNNIKRLNIELVDKVKKCEKWIVSYQLAKKQTEKQE